jgi:hypothetical protein
MLAILRIAVELTVQNEKGETIAVGGGCAIVPAGLLPPAEWQSSWRSSGLLSA